jgi:hypothetical protein
VHTHPGVNICRWGHGTYSLYTICQWYMCTKVSTIFPILPCSSDVYLSQRSFITWPFSQTEVCLPIVSSLSPSTMHSNYCDLFIFLTHLIPLLMSLKSHKWFTTQAQCSSFTNGLLHYPTHPPIYDCTAHDLRHKIHTFPHTMPKTLGMIAIHQSLISHTRSWPILTRAGGH